MESSVERAGQAPEDDDDQTSADADHRPATLPQDQGRVVVDDDSGIVDLFLLEMERLRSMIELTKATWVDDNRRIVELLKLEGEKLRSKIELTKAPTGVDLLEIQLKRQLGMS
eukprot:TRINITY_DN118890_c0_g1_i1.p2 TRINITY_DN118890_c0_g1~~TRINITY_DN118890_c0_g1_i1.p2  ORF type:complete len:113 (-),score=31.24 TRINITY_DN118890_c0_g1_i1:126-464(-)